MNTVAHYLSTIRTLTFFTSFRFFFDPPGSVRTRFLGSFFLFAIQLCFLRPPSSFHSMSCSSIRALSLFLHQALVPAALLTLHQFRESISKGVSPLCSCIVALFSENCNSFLRFNFVFLCSFKPLKW